MLEGRRVLLGISGGIAAYKMPQLIRLLVKAGAEVQVIMTESAKDFVSELVLSTLSHRPALSSYIHEGEGNAKAWNNHVELGLWPDLMLFAPLTANTLAKMVAGQADNLLLATYLSARCPVMLAPAMDLDMYQHPSFLRNIKQVAEDGCKVIPAESGELASGLSGQGRLPEPETLFEHISNFFQEGSLIGKKFLINAGPTYEAIDPVRYIGNHSSGKMGIALTKEVLKRGGTVRLVLGPVKEKVESHPQLEIHSCFSAEEMNTLCRKFFPSVDAAIMSAAVSDYQPAQVSSSKIKKRENDLDIRLKPTPDILKGLGENKAHQVLVGFALETDNAEENGRSKLERKNLDFIIVNEPSERTGFGTETNQAIFLDNMGNRMETGLVSKEVMAKLIIDKLESILEHA
jgi:phosphopantothenoylcysteine decarboxylase/phosphopantothenate--cysteine ligase